jgi:uncharacterized protein YndB with AHSA1/START domain
MIDGEQVVHEIVLPVPPSDAFDMFVDPERLIRWIGISADIEPRPGGRFRFEVMPGQYCEGRYEVVEPPRHLEFTWGWSDPGMGVPPGSSTVAVSFTPEGPDGLSTRLRLVHRDLPDDDRGPRLHDDGWARFLARLTAVLTGAEAPEYPSEPYTCIARSTMSPRASETNTLTNATSGLKSRSFSIL